VLAGSPRNEYPDVICLQELTQRHFTLFFMPRLAAAGFQGVFQPPAGFNGAKRTRAECVGVGTFFRASEYTLTAQTGVRFSNMVEPNAAIQQIARRRGPKGKKRIMSRYVLQTLTI
jgi:mRNA deadenylase 3'-5' endonuclease subunit Ccr4